MYNFAVLTLIATYLPGYKSGGPIKTIVNMVEKLRTDFNFLIITSNHDIDGTIYNGIQKKCWNNVGNAKVYYLADSYSFFCSMVKLLRRTKEYDLVYLNSFFSFKFTIFPLILRRLKIVPRIATVIAPRGEFSAGALALKRNKKRIYIKIAKQFGIYDGLIWQASSEYEKNDILSIFPRKNVVVAPDLVTTKDMINGDIIQPCETKRVGELKLVFISRISRMKNLCGALQFLQKVVGTVEFDIYGPIEDKQYWQECMNEIKNLPANITARYLGVLEPVKVHKVFAEHHAFFFPTYGENFGHVIFESLAAGCPVVISDQTPWRNLQQSGVGWDVALDAPDEFVRIIEQMIEWSQEEYLCYSKTATQYAMNISSNKQIIDSNRNLFLTALAQKDVADNL